MSLFACPLRPAAGRSPAPLSAAGLCAIGLAVLLCLAPRHGGWAADGETQADRQAEELDASEDGSGDEQPDEAIDFTLTINGVENSAILDLLKETSVLESLRDTPATNDVTLLRRVQDDQKRFDAVMRSEGFYEAKVRYEIDRGASPYEITFDIAPGRRFILTAYDIRYVGDEVSTAPAPSTPESLGLSLGKPAKADAIVAAQTRFLQRLANEAHPLAKVVDRKAVVDYDTAEMTVELLVDPGRRALFGPLNVEGITRTKPDYLRRVVNWQPGTPYDQRRIESLRKQLADMGLFSTVRIEIPKEVDSNDELPVTVSLIESKARSIGFGVAYSSDEGAGVEAFWEHRNFFGEQDSLKVTALASELRQSLGFDFEKPNSPTIDKTLLINGTLAAQQSDAYNEKSASAFLGVREDLNEEWEITYGVAPEYSKVDDNDSDEDWIGVGLPVIFRQDATDSLLDPSEGHRLTFSITPVFGELSRFSRFVITEFNPSIYLKPLPTDRLIFAARGRIGSILGESRTEIPANHRFYAGGGGSIRGYEFQSVGPRDKDHDPIGGRSVVEMGAEMRVRATETIGVVPFVEGGTAYKERIPGKDEEIRWAAGLGLRYFTAIGPLRLDFAFPLNRRRSDDSFQFYVSIGQAF